MDLDLWTGQGCKTPCMGQGCAKEFLEASSMYPKMGQGCETGHLEVVAEPLRCQPLLDKWSGF